MKNEKGGALVFLIALTVIVVIVIEYYVSNGKPFSNLLNFSGDSSRSYSTYREHLALKDREKRTAELKTKISNLFGSLIKNSKTN